MADVFAVGFEQVQLLSGLPEDHPVWLYMRADVLDPAQPDKSVASAEVGSLPPDANRFNQYGLPLGDAGRYAASLPVGAFVRNDGEWGAPRFKLMPLPMADDQVMRVHIFMYPKVWFTTQRISIKDWERFVLWLIAMGWGGVAGLGVAEAIMAFFGLFTENTTATVPNYQTVITCSLEFTTDDLRAIATEGMRSFGPRENIGSPFGTIDSLFFLSVNHAEAWPGFGNQASPGTDACELRPHAHYPEPSWLAGRWADTNDWNSYCLFVSITVSDALRATVYIAHAEKVGQTYTDLAIELDLPDPPFIRNVFDDACPARSVSPSCPECHSFSNLTQFIPLPKAMFMAATLGGRHVGAGRAFRPDPAVVDAWYGPLACGRERDVLARELAAHVGAPERPSLAMRIASGWMAEETSHGDIHLWPAGTPPPRVLDFRPKRDARVVDDDQTSILRYIGAFKIVLNERETLFSYGEFHGDKACCGRIRYIKRNGEGRVVADILLQLLDPLVR